MITDNPSIWYCLGCLSAKTNESSMSNNGDIAQEGGLLSDVVLHSTMMNFKKEILALVAETMDAKLNVLPSLLSAKTNSDTFTTVKDNMTPLPNKADQLVISSSSPNHDSPQTWAQICDNTSGNNCLSSCTNTGNVEIREKPQKHVLLLEPVNADDTSSDDAKKKSLQNINSAISGVNVEFCSFKRSGLVAVGFSDSKSKSLAEEKIKDNVSVSSAFKTRLPRQLLPKVTISGINEVLFDSCGEDKEQMKAILKNDIIKRNEAVRNALESDSDNALLEVVMLQKVMPSHFSVSYIAALKMSSCVRKAIYNNGDKLYVSLKRCKVVDRYHVMQCYRCQEPGHLAKDCKNEHPTCYYCSKNHRSKDCTLKKSEANQCCSNCLKSSNPNIAKDAKTHTAASQACPVLQSHINSMKQKTERWQEKNLLF